MLTKLFFYLRILNSRLFKLILGLLKFCSKFLSYVHFKLLYHFYFIINLWLKKRFSLNPYQYRIGWNKNPEQLRRYILHAYDVYKTDSIRNFMYHKKFKLCLTYWFWLEPTLKSHTRFFFYVFCIRVWCLFLFLFLCYTYFTSFHDLQPYDLLEQASSSCTIDTNWTLYTSLGHLLSIIYCFWIKFKFIVFSLSDWDLFFQRSLLTIIYAEIPRIFYYPLWAQDLTLYIIYKCIACLSYIYFVCFRVILSVCYIPSLFYWIVPSFFFYLYAFISNCVNTTIINLLLYFQTNYYFFSLINSFAMIYLLKFIKITGSIIIYSPIFLQLILSHQYMLYLFFFDFIITDIIGFSFCMCDGFLKLLNIVPYLTYFFFDWFHWLITKLYLYSYLYCFFIYIKNLSFITLFIILFLISLLKYIFFKMYFEYFSLNLYFFYDFQIDLTYIFFLDLKKKILSFLLSDYILSFFMDFEVPRLPIDLNNYSYYIQLKPALDYHPLFYSYCIHPTARIYHHIFDRLSIYKEEYVLIMYFDKISDFYHTFIGSVYNPCILERNQGHKTVMYYYSFSQSRLSYGFSDFNFYLNRLYILNRKFCKVWDRKYYVDDYFIPERRILYSYFNLNRFVEHYLSTNFYNQYTHISYKNYFLNTFFKPKITYISTCYNISDFTLISYFIPFYICSWIIDTIWNPISKLLGMPLSTFDSFTDIMSISKPYTYDYYDLLNLQFYIKDFFFLVLL